MGACGPSGHHRLTPGATPWRAGRRPLNSALVNTETRPLGALLPGRLTRRQLLGWGSLPLLATSLQACAPIAPRAPHPAGAPSLRLLGEARLPYRMAFEGTTVGGLSGLDYDPASGTWVAISDDRSEHQPARFYTLDLQISTSGIDRLALKRVVTLRDADGQPYPSRKRWGQSPAGGRPDVPDPESIRFRPDTRTLLWSSEGDAAHGLSPALREINLEGRQLREFPLPPELEVGPDPKRGPRNNLSFEGLAVTPDSRHVWVSMEAPLLEDGPVPTPGQAGGPCRLTRFDLSTGQADLQRAYLPDALPRAPIPATALAENGISEILMEDEHHLLVLERAYMSGVGMSLALYRVDTREGSDTLAQDPLQPGHYRPLNKTLVADFGQLGISRLDNTEGMCWGPTLANGHRSLVFVSDDNFNPLQITQFLAFEYLPASS